MRRLGKLVLADRTGIPEFVQRELEEMAEEVVVYDDIPADAQTVVERIRDADGIMVSWNTRITAEMLAQCPRLSYVGLCCTYYGEAACNVDAGYCREHGIEIRGVSHYGDPGVAEFVLSELIRMVKGLGEISFYPEQRELGGMRLGVIGLGTVGKLIADAAAHFGMEVAYYNRRKRSDCPYIYKEKMQLLRESDAVVTCVPRDRVVMAEEEFRALGTHKIFLNVGVGPSYDPEAFARWIGEGGYAILDAGSIDEERRGWYQRQERISLAKHVAGFTCNARRRLAKKAAGNLRDYLNGTPERAADGKDAGLPG